MNKNNKLKKTTKGCLMVVGAVFAPIIIYFMITGCIILFHNIFEHDEYIFTLCTGDGGTGYRSVILCEGDTTIMLPQCMKNTCYVEGKFFRYHGKNEVVDVKFISCDYGCWVIPCYVAEQKSDSDYMLVDQKPIDSIFGIEENVYDGDGKFIHSIRLNEPNNNKSRYKMLDESPIHQFWIIALRTADVYGPLTYEDYKRKRTELGVPSKLRLKYEKSFEE